MKCYECGGTYRGITGGTLERTDAFVGPFVVPDVAFYSCSECGDELLPPATMRAIDAKREEVLQNLLRNRPLDAFMTAADAAVVLDISRQALHKHRRVRRGFIFQTKFGGKTVYLAQSVHLFNISGDGRFPLVESMSLSAKKVLKYDQVEPAIDLVLGCTFSVEGAPAFPAIFGAEHQTHYRKDFIHGS